MTPDERAATAALYPTSARQVAGATKQPPRRVNGRGPDHQEEPLMAAPTVHPETARRGSLLEAASDETLVALAERGDHADRRAARAEQLRRGVMPFTRGTRVKGSKPFSRWTGTVRGRGASDEFPISVRWDNGIIESCTPDELDVIPANVVALDRALGESRG